MRTSRRTAAHRLALALLECALYAGSAALAQETSAKTQAPPEPHNLTPTLQLPVQVVVFDFQRPQLSPPRWGFVIRADGTGSYYTQAAPSGTAWQDVKVGPQTMERILSGAHHDGRCETKEKRIARTGQKTLSYLHDDAWFSCTFNYSDNEVVMKTFDVFQAMEETMEFGERLEHEHRFDRLSLDAEMTSLEAEMKAGRAMEVGNIAPTLRAIAMDERVIDRVRRKAARMLEQVPATGPLQEAGAQ